MGYATWYDEGYAAGRGSLGPLEQAPNYNPSYVAGHAAGRRDQERLRTAAAIIRREGVNLGGYPYSGGIMPRDAMRRAGGVEYLMDEVVGQIERGMTTEHVAGVFEAQAFLTG